MENTKAPKLNDVFAESSDPIDQMRQVFRKNRLPFSPCGLNADWSYQAFHLGPSPKPNVTDGDLYIVDEEDDNGGDTYSLVRYNPIAGEAGTVDSYETLESGLLLVDVCKLARKKLTEIHG